MKPTVLTLLSLLVVGCATGVRPVVEYVSFYGDIKYGLYNHISTELPRKSILTITSRGGDVMEAIAVAQLVNERDVTVVAEGYCMSACLLIYTAAKNRSYVEGTTFGIHQATTEFGSDLYLKYMKKWGANDQFETIFNSVPNSEMYYLDGRTYDLLISR